MINNQDLGQALELLARAKKVSAITKARAIAAAKTAGVTQVTVAERLDISQSQVSRYLRLLELPEEVQVKIESGEITPRAAWELLPKRRIRVTKRKQKKQRHKRIGLSKRIRFEVLQRDNFTCQYCGRSKPDVVLHVDHIKPVCEGGQNDLLNLVTACADCNLGKGPRQISQQQIQEKCAAERERLVSERQHLTDMHAWHVTRASLDKESVYLLAELWQKITSFGELAFSEEGLELIQLLLRKFSFDEIADAMRLSFSKNGPGNSNQAFYDLARCCGIVRLKTMNPDEARKRYILGILRNRISPNLSTAASLIDEAIANYGKYDDIEFFAKRCTCWSHFRDLVLDYLYSEEEAT